MRITKNVQYSEVIASDTAKRKGIKNKPDEKQLKRITELCENIFQPLRDNFGVPIYISSCFRSYALNIAIGGAANSQHMAEYGAAMDLDADRYGQITNKQIFDYIKYNLDYDQLIWEFGDDKNPAWIHVSYKKNDNRGMILKAYKENGLTQYERLK